MPSPPALGALGMTFTAMRAMQGVSLITMIGLSANFVSQAVENNNSPPQALVGTLVVGCLAMIYVAVSYILYWDFMLPMLIGTGADAVVLIMVIVVAVIVGKPVSYLKCQSFSNKGNTANFIDSLYHNVKNHNDNVFKWVDPDKATCFEVKALWGLSIALCILFAFSSITCICLWRRMKPSHAEPPKDFE